VEPPASDRASDLGQKGCLRKSPRSTEYSVSIPWGIAQAIGLTKYRTIADIPTTKNVAALISIDTRKGRKQLLTLKPARIAIAWGTVIPPVQLIFASMISAADVLWRKTSDPTSKSTAFHRGDMNFVASFLKGWLPIYSRIWVRLLMPVNRKPSPTKKRDSGSIGKPETINV
jgi:hypothetical protein